MRSVVDVESKLGLLKTNSGAGSGAGGLGVVSSQVDLRIRY